MFKKLKRRGFDVLALHHAEAILSGDMPEAEEEIDSVIGRAQIPVEELIRGGGGEHDNTQRMRNALAELGWVKHTFTITKSVDGVEKESITHEIDHVKAFPKGTLACRLKLAKTLLRKDGVIFISIDDNEASQLQLVCDEVFGEESHAVTMYVQVRYATKTLAEKNDYQKLIEHVFAYAGSGFVPIKATEEYKLDKFCWKITELSGRAGITGRIGGRAPEFPGGRIGQTGFLDAAAEYLGPGYREVSPGRYVSADGLRQVRFGAHEVRGPGLHGHFEAYDQAGGRVIENTRVDIIGD